MSATRLHPYRVQILNRHGHYEDCKGMDDPKKAIELCRDLQSQGQSARLLGRTSEGWIPCGASLYSAHSALDVDLTARRAH